MSFWRSLTLTLWLVPRERSNHKTPVKTEKNTITGETRTRLPYVELGKIMLSKHGEAACQSGYQTTDPEWVGRYALQYGDIRPDGTLN